MGGKSGKIASGVVKAASKVGSALSKMDKAAKGRRFVSRIEKDMQPTDYRDAGKAAARKVKSMVKK